MDKQIDINDHNTQQIDQNSVSHSFLEKPKINYQMIGGTILLCFLIFGFAGYHFGKNQLANTNIVKTANVASDNFSKIDKPEANMLYRGTVNDTDVVFLANQAQTYYAGIPDDPFTGKLYGQKIYSNGSKTKIDTFTDFRKIEIPTKLVSFGETPVSKLYDTLVSNLNHKIFVFVSFSSETVRDGKPKYSLYEIDTNTFNLKEIWSYDLEANPLNLNNTEIFPSFGELTDDTYLTFSINGYFNSWEGQMAVLNLKTGMIKYLPKSIEVKVNSSKGIISYKPITNLNVKVYPGGGYTPEQIKEINNATGQVIEEPLP